MSRCADVCIIELYHTLKKIPFLAGFHGFSEPVKDVSRGLVGHMQLSHEVQCGHSALVGHEQIGGNYPVFQLDVRAVHECAVRGRDLLTEEFAAHQMPACNCAVLRAAAERAYEAVLETQVINVPAAVILV